jgi:hypothetical protein
MRTTLHAHPQTCTPKHTAIYFHIAEKVPWQRSLHRSLFLSQRLFPPELLLTSPNSIKLTQDGRKLCPVRVQLLLNVRQLLILILLVNKNTRKSLQPKQMALPACMDSTSCHVCPTASCLTTDSSCIPSWLSDPVCRDQATAAQTSKTAALHEAKSLVRWLLAAMGRPALLEPKPKCQQAQNTSTLEVCRVYSFFFETQTQTVLTADPSKTLLESSQDPS